MSYQNDPKLGYQSPQPQHQQYQTHPDHYQQPQQYQGPPQQYQGPEAVVYIQTPYPAPQAQMEHKPHPVQHSGGKAGAWHHGMCDCFGDCGKCCLSCWCPCMTYGKIQHRLRNEDMKTYSNCNGHCWGFCALGVCGLQWVMSMMQRGEIRHRYNVEGSGLGDCCRHFCCECCALIQEDRETETRKSLLVPSNSAGYQQQGGMTYPSH